MGRLRRIGFGLGSIKATLGMAHFNGWDDSRLDMTSKPGPFGPSVFLLVNAFVTTNECVSLTMTQLWWESFTTAINMIAITYLEQ
jgi:hypothetical protein